MMLLSVLKEIYSQSETEKGHFMKRCLILFSLLALLTGCQSQTGTQAVQRDVFAMDTYMTLTAYGTKADAALGTAVERLSELDTTLSATDPNSQVYAYNHGDKQALGDEAAALKEQALTLGARTGGALDITIYPLVQAWGFTADVQRVPPQEELDALLAEEQDTVDFGAVAKGYAGDVVTGLLREAGVTSAIINLGGNVQCVGSKPDGSDWKVAIQNPTSSASYLGSLAVSNQAVITSGGYERNFEIDGVRYHHILDPQTGCPADSGLISVTIVANSGLLADGLSTALFVMGLDDAWAHYEAHDDFEAILVTQEGEVYLTPGLRDSFTLLDESYTLIEVLP